MTPQSLPDEDAREAVHEADKARAPIVVRYARALDSQLAYGEEAVARGMAEVDDMRVRAARFATAVTPVDRDAISDEGVELSVVLDERAGEVDARELLDRLVVRFGRQLWVQPLERSPKVAREHGGAF